MTSDEITVAQLRWILNHASGDATLAEAVEEFAEAERREAETLEHNERQRVYFEYLERRQEREHEQVAAAGEDAKRTAIAAGPVSKDRAYVIFKEAADLERLRFEVREPRLEFEEWIDAGSPDVHQIRGARDPQGKLAGALPAL